MSESNYEETRAIEQNAEEDFLFLSSAPQFVGGHLEDVGDAPLCQEPLPTPQTQERKGNGSDYEDAASSEEDSDGRQPSSGDPRADRSHGDGSEAVSSVGHGQGQERRMRSGGCRPHRTHRTRGHSGQRYADQRELGGEWEWAARPEWRVPRAFFPGSEFPHWVAAAGSGPARSWGPVGLSEGAVLAPLSSPWFVPGPSQFVEEALRRPELAAERQRRPCRWPVWLERRLWPSCSSYPDLGPWEWSWGRPHPSSAYMEHCPKSPVRTDSRACQTCKGTGQNAARNRRARTRQKGRRPCPGTWEKYKGLADGLLQVALRAGPYFRTFPFLFQAFLYLAQKAIAYLRRLWERK